MNPKIKIILFFLYTLLLLQGCGGSAGPQVAEGGIGGTGITFGRIKAFGSIIVNGVRYDTDNATFIRDNTEVNSQNDFVVGEVVTIKGTVNADGITGTATSVVFSDIVDGPVTVKAPLLATSLEVLGQTVHINDLTILHGFIVISDLAVGDIVEVSGFFDANGDIQATSIRLNNSPVESLEIKGKLSNVDLLTKTFMINNLVVDYSNADNQLSDEQLTEGVQVEVSARILLNTRLIAETVRAVIPVELTAEKDTEIEGIITRFVSSSDFDVNGIPILITANTIFEDGSVNELALNVLVDVEGIVNAEGSLVADTVGLEHVENLPKIEANIESIDFENQTFVTFGQTIHTNISTLFFDESKRQENPFQFNKLRVGDYIDAKLHIETDGRLVALRLSREEQENDSSFKGIVHDINTLEGSFSILGISMITDTNTAYFNTKKEPVDQATFLASIKEGITIIEVEGYQAGNNQVKVRSVFVDISP